MIYIGYTAFKTERYQRLTQGFDYQGNTCGEGICADSKFRFSPYADQPFFALCVNQCPSATGIVVTALTSCSGSIPPDVLNPILASVTPLASETSVKLRSFCVPTALPEGLSDIPGQGEFTRVVEALGDAWRVLLLSVFISMVGALLFICLIRFCGGTLMLTLVIGIVAAFAGTGYLLTTKAEEYTDKEDKDVKTSMLAFGYAAYFCAFMAICFVCCLWKEFLMAVRVIKEGTHAVAAMKKLNLVPLIKWVMMTALVAWFSGVAVCVVASSDLVKINLNNCTDDIPPSPCSTLRNLLQGVVPGCDATACDFEYETITVSKELRYALVYHIFGFYWNA
jgi:hypothetical protein